MITWDYNSPSSTVITKTESDTAAADLTQIHSGQMSGIVEIEDPTSTTYFNYSYDCVSDLGAIEDKRKRGKSKYLRKRKSRKSKSR